MQSNFTNRIFSIQTSHDFEKLALEIFNYQAEYCKVYSNFIKNLGIKAEQIRDINHIPYLPVEFFKTHQVICGNDLPEQTFTSSGTTGMTQSRHLIQNISIYKNSFRKTFEKFYGNIKEYTILALLPTYLKREGSSLIYMVDDFIRESGNKKSGYFLYNHAELNETLNHLKKTKTPTLLIGVTYALLDFVENYSLEFPELIVMETGGMKGKRREMIKEELHEILCAGFGVPAVHSEYGMTELLSQAYSKGAGLFHSPSWMKINIRNTNDPFELLNYNQIGGINIMDLANINSCSFIATQDLGKIYADESFEVLGRFDYSDIRGCNLLIQ